jgi:putative Holliday junction resolvase
VRCLGLDLGARRTGVAMGDPEGVLATPLTVLASKDEDELISEILRLVDQYKVECVVVGLPRRLDGELGEQARKVTAFTDRLVSRAKQGNWERLDVKLWDERLSTKAAERLKVEGSRRGNRGHAAAGRTGRRHRFSAKAGIDAIAAALILQGYLDSRPLEQ